MKSFFEKLTGATDLEDSIDINSAPEEHRSLKIEHVGDRKAVENNLDWMKDEQEEGELTIDMYQQPDKIIIKTIVAGVKPEDLDISITRDMVTIRGKREEATVIEEDDYYEKELYWGSFSRTITLPTEIDIDMAEASEQHGMLTITLPKTDKGKKAKLKVKSLHTK